MGVTLYNKEYNMDMGMGSFYQLRRIVANFMNSEFGEHYSNILKCRTKNDFIAFDKKTEQLVKKYNLDEDILDFLFQSDCDGKINSKTCAKIYELVKNYETNMMFGYYYSNNSFTYFKSMLADCAKKRRNLYWH